MTDSHRDKVVSHAPQQQKGIYTFLSNCSTTWQHGQAEPALCLDHHMSLPACTRADPTWWHTYLWSLNSTSLQPAAEPTHLIYSAASSSWGYSVREGHSWFMQTLHGGTHICMWSWNSTFILPAAEPTHFIYLLSLTIIYLCSLS